LGELGPAQEVYCLENAKKYMIHLKRWVILSHGFNMDGRAASQTITDKIPYLLKAGIDPIIISAKTGVKDKQVKHHQLWPWGASGFRFDFRHWWQRKWGRGFLYSVLTGLLSILLFPFVLLEKIFIGLPGYWSWAMPAAIKTWWLVRTKKVDLVYSTGGAWSAILAGWWVKKLTGVPWIVEVHDPLVHRGDKKNTSSRNDRFQGWLEKKISKDADLVWWFTEGALHYAKKRSPGLGRRGFSVLAGSEQLSKKAEYKKTDKLNFNHFGSLSGTRSLAPFLSDLLKFCDSQSDALDKIQVNVYGVNDLDSETNALIAKEPALGQIVKVHGRLEKDKKTGLSGRDRVYQKMCESDILLLLHGHESWCQEYIPSKAYEYFWTGRPVFGLTYQNKQLDRLIKERGGYVAKSESTTSAQAQLEKIWNAWLQGGLPANERGGVSIESTVDAIIAGVNKEIIAKRNLALDSNNLRKEKSKEVKGQKSYARLLKYALPQWKAFVLSTLGFVMYASMQPLFAMTIDYVVEVLNSGNREKVTFLPLFFIALFLIRGVGSFVGNYFLAIVSTSVVHKLRTEIFNQYTRLPVEYFDENSSGYLMSRITHNVGEVTTATTDSVKTLIREGLTAISLLVYLVYVNWLLSVTFLIVAPFLVVLIVYVSKRMRMLSVKLQNSVGDMSQITSELVRGQRTVKSFGGESFERRRFKEASLINRRQCLKLTVTQSINSPLTQVILSIALAMLMYLALEILIDAETGTIIGYLTAAFLLPKPVKSLSDANVGIQRGIAAAGSLFEVLDKEIQNDLGEREIEKARGDINFKNVTFCYQGAETPALLDVSVKIKAGATVALVGASGAGKTSFINLLSRFYDCDSGEVLLDGVPINEYKLGSYRKQITLVEQANTLFDDTIVNNIAYGEEKEEQDMGRIQEVAKLAYAEGFILKLENQYEELVGEEGVKLSGGQKQRLSLARAMYKDAPILILDEATSALDSESEAFIQSALERVSKNRTTIVIAHRLSTIQNADIILVMDKGRIVEQGTHAELLKRGLIYHRLHELQFGRKGIEK